MTDMSKIEDIDSEMGMLHKQLEQLHGDQAKLLEKEHELRTRLQHLQIKKDRLGPGSGGSYETGDDHAVDSD